MFAFNNKAVQTRFAQGRYKEKMQMFQLPYVYASKPLKMVIKTDKNGYKPISFLSNFL